MKKQYSIFSKAIAFALASFWVSCTVVLGMEDIEGSKSSGVKKNDKEFVVTISIGPKLPKPAVFDGICLFGWQIKKGVESPNKRLQTTEGELEFEGNPAPLHHMIIDAKIYRAKKHNSCQSGRVFSWRNSKGNQIEGPALNQKEMIMNFHLHTIHPDLEKLSYDEYDGILLSGKQIIKAFENNKRLRTTEGEFQFKGNPEPFHHLIEDDKLYGACESLPNGDIYHYVSDHYVSSSGVQKALKSSKGETVLKFIFSKIPEPFKLYIVPAYSLSKISDQPDYKFGSLVESLKSVRRLEDSGHQFQDLDQYAFKHDRECFQISERALNTIKAKGEEYKNDDLVKVKCGSTDDSGKIVYIIFRSDKEGSELGWFRMVPVDEIVYNYSAVYNCNSVNNESTFVTERENSLPKLLPRPEAKAPEKRDFTCILSDDLRDLHPMFSDDFFGAWERRNIQENFHRFSCSIGYKVQKEHYFKIDAQYSNAIDLLKYHRSFDKGRPIGASGHRIDPFMRIGYNKENGQYEIQLTDLVPTGGDEGAVENHAFPVQEINQEEFNRK